MASYTPQYNWVGFYAANNQGELVAAHFSLVPTSPIAACVAGKKIVARPISFLKIHGS